MTTDRTHWEPWPRQLDRKLDRNLPATRQLLDRSILVRILDRYSTGFSSTATTRQTSTDLVRPRQRLAVPAGPAPRDRAAARAGPGAIAPSAEFVDAASPPRSPPKVPLMARHTCIWTLTNPQQILGSKLITSAATPQSRVERGITAVLQFVAIRGMQMSSK